MADLLGWRDGQMTKWYSGNTASPTSSRRPTRRPTSCRMSAKADTGCGSRAAVIRDSRGELVGAVETLENIADRVAENALKKRTTRRSGKSS